ncbi:MAG: YceI family protein [Actinobacteria bacterium]|nr:MAG: YceI family protein [Actinomycetota bacterium]
MREKWVFDPHYSTLWFRVNHLGVSRVRGTFRTWRGFVCMGEGGLSDSTAEIIIDPSSLETGDAPRDELAMGPLFLDTGRFDTIEFVADEVQVVDSHHLRLIGLLTLHGVTRPVPVDVTWRGEVLEDDGSSRLGFEATATVRRKDFGVVWTGPAEAAADFLIGDTVELTFEVEALRNPTGC